jgi:hypothetical protein
MVVGFYLDFVDVAEFENIDRDFGVIDGFEHLDDAVF